MSRTRLALAAVLFAPAAARADGFDPKPVEAVVEKAMAEFRVPGAAVVVVRGDRVVYLKGFGVREEGKPEQAIAKITEGRLNGFFKDVVLLEQPSVSESKKTVQAVLDESGTTVRRFARFEVGA